MPASFIALFNFARSTLIACFKPFTGVARHWRELGELVEIRLSRRRGVALEVV